MRSFLGAGFAVVLAAPQDALLGIVAREFRPLAERTLIVPTDITVRADVDALVARALVAFGRIDVLANVAGIGSSPSLCDCTDDELERVLAVNLLGAARLMHAVLPVLKAQRRGAIVNVGSVAGEAGVMGIYSASKFGLRGLSDSVRREVRSFNIGVTLVEPGFVRTPMNPSMRDLPGPEIVADAILAAASRPRRVHVVPAHYRVPVFLMKTFPALADMVFGSARIQQRLNRDARAERAARPAAGS
ncbi:MAG: SDR family oxidoreductase [Candidatus Eremiobacteraeota bacterium]|nr:SDR family oxidoreductase [Candidatus Eremiobacteraeota bacterium]